jgi:cobalamin biosynthesis protein CbiD
MANEKSLSKSVKQFVNDHPDVTAGAVFGAAAVLAPTVAIGAAVGGVGIVALKQGMKWWKEASKEDDA